MGNHFRLSEDGSYCIGQFTTGGEFLYDVADHPLISQYTWQRGKRGYPTTGINRKTTVMHRVLYGFPSGVDIDHISGDKLDNRRANLRICTHQENMFNQKMRNTNTSGFTGVSYLKNTRSYEAYIHHSGKKHHLGLFADPADAAVARDHAARRLFGEFARMNFPKDSECAYG